MGYLDNQAYEKILDFLSIKFKDDAMKSMTYLLAEIFDLESIFFLTASSDKRQLNYIALNSSANSFQEINFSLNNFKHPFSQIVYKRQLQEIEEEELRVWQGQSSEFKELVFSENLQSGIVVIPLFYQNDLIYGCFVLDITDYHARDIDPTFLNFCLTLVAQHLKNIESVRLKEDEGLYLTRSITRSEQTYLNYLKTIELQKEIVATTPMMESIITKMAQVIDSDMSILFSGEHGTGKSFLAKCLHTYSTKSKRACVIVDCSDNSLHDEKLFFSQTGFLSKSHRGTLILENVSSLPETLQEKLVFAFLNESYVLSDIEVTKPYRARIIATTKEQQSDLLKKKLLRPDFFAQISQIIFSLPTLNERKADIKFFLEQFITQFNKKNVVSKQIVGYTDRFLKQLISLNWDDNLHSLHKYLEIKAQAVNDGILKTQRQIYGKSPEVQQNFLIEDFVDELLEIDHLELDSLLNRVEASIIKQELERNEGKRQLVARKLKIPLRTLAYKCQKYGL